LIKPNAEPVLYLGVSRTKLAELLSVSEFELWKIETTNKHLQPKLLDKLTAIFNVPEEALAIKVTHYKTDELFNWGIVSCLNWS